ncbi:MAG: toxic anion resistance protein [Patescibacteria group bacterium]
MNTGNTEVVDQSTNLALPPEAPVPSTSTALVPLEVQAPDAIVPFRPTFVSDARDQELRATADEIVGLIKAEPTSVSVTSKLYELGSEAMNANTENISLYDTKIGDVLGEIAEGSPVQKSLVEIKTQLDLINPSVLGSKKVGGIVGGLFAKLPGAEQILVMINEQKDSVTDTIEGIKRTLWEERDKAVFNAIELSKIADKLADTQEQLQEAAYVGQLVWGKLGAIRDGEQDPVRKQALENLVTDLAVLVVDIQTVDTLNVQSRLASEALVSNCRKIQQAVTRTTTVLLPAVKINLAVRAGAAQQLKLARSLGQINDAAGQTIADTAMQTRKAVTEVAKFQSEGMINTDKLQQACDEYIAMSDEVAEISRQTEEKARTASAELQQLRNVMSAHADPLTAARRAHEQLPV